MGTEKKRLKTRILRNILIIWVIAMITSSTVSYIYFSGIVRKQVLTDGNAKLEQISGQIRFFMEDLDNFAKAIAADEEVQEALGTDSDGSAFEEAKSRDTMSKRLRFFNSLRTYVSGSFLESNNGKRFISSTSSNSPEQVEQKFATEEIAEFREDKSAVLSAPYYSIDNWDKGKQLVCCRYTIYDQFYYGKELGTVYVEVYLDYFGELLDNSVEEPLKLWMTGENGQLLYGEISEEDADLYGKIPEAADGGDVKTRIPGGGYLLSENVDAAGSTLYLEIPGAYLWERSGFVLWFFVISFAITIAVTLLAASRMLEGVIRPVTQLSRYMRQAHYDRLTMHDALRTGDEIETLYESYNNMVGEIQRGVQERLAYEKKMKEMEFDIMLSQINPHYLYNVLHTVVYLSAAGRNKEVVQVTNALIFSLQETLKLGSGDVETTVERELELARCYLDIQKYRYPGRYQTKIDCEREAREARVPKTVLQPLVENAIVHGILPLEEPGWIWVRIFREKESLVIEVEDNGEGMQEEKLRAFEEDRPQIDETNGRRHIGIRNIRDRIRYLYGEPYDLWIFRREEGGTRVVLRVPWKTGE